MLPQAEMGQGILTALSMMVAEELEVGLDQVRVEHAPGDDRLYANPHLGFQATGGSTSVRAFYEPMRQAGAAARSLLVAAAAESWGVDPGSCRAEKGAVIHSGTGRTVTYGEVAERAAKLPAPDKVALKDPKDFTPHRYTGQAARHAVQGQWDGAVWHRRAGAGDEDRHRRCQPGPGRHGGGAG